MEEKTNSWYFNISSQKDNRLLAKLGDDGFSLVLFGTKVADSKEFCKKSIIVLIVNHQYFYTKMWGYYNYIPPLKSLCFKSPL